MAETLKLKCWEPVLNKPIDHIRLLTVLKYDASKGIFCWIKSPNPMVKAGSEAGSTGVHNDGYKKIKLDKVFYSAHRLAWFYVFGVWPTGQIDHINGNRLDNRIENLRDVPKQINSENTRKARSDSLSGIQGVAAHGLRWKAAITVNGKKRHLGVFKTQDAAHEAYIFAKRKFHTGCTL